MTLKEINLEIGYPPVDQAMIRLKNEIATCKRTASKYLKVVHGYGSTGVGGAIKVAVLDYLQQQLQSKCIKAYIKGEEFGSGYHSTTCVVQQYPQLKNCADYNKQNGGITIVVVV